MGEPQADELLTDITDPLPFPGVNHHLLLGRGAPVDELDRLSNFSDKQFEIFVHQWAYGYLKTKYNDVQRRGGAGDKGRDVVAWIDPKGTPDRRWDNYQCKRYDKPLAPTTIWEEIGKLCYYTFIGDYTQPQEYRFVTTKGVGPALADLFDNPEKLRGELKRNWEKYCRGEITKKHEIPLEGALEAYVDSFDFSIFGYIEPLTILDEHSKTKYHAPIFGTGLKPRPPATHPPMSIAITEARYVDRIYEAFSDHLKTPVTGPSDFSHRSMLVEHFNHARICFYCAESLKEFARDNLPDDSYFPSLMEEFYGGVFHTVNNPHHRDGLERMIKTVEVAQSLSITAHALCEVLETNDKTGICHHLANEDRIRWVS